MSPFAHQHLTNPLEVARQLARTGQFKKARGAYKRALKLDPNRPEILSELGSVEAESGNIPAARQLMRKAVRLSPSNAAFHFNLGELERQAERYPQAEESFRAAIGLQPNDADALLGLGTALLLQDRPQDALEPLLRAHRLAPDDHEGLNELGSTLARLGRHEEAVEVYHRALSLRPDYVNGWLNLALCCFDAGRFHNAIAAFDRAEKLEPIPAGLAWKRTLAQAQNGLLAEAAATADAGIAADPENHQAHFVRGTVALYRGDFDVAETAIRCALALNPNFVEAYEKLSMIGRISIDEAVAIERILASNAGMNDADRAAVGFSLYRLYDRASRTGEAFRALMDANRIKARLAPFDAQAHAAEIHRHIEVFSREFLDSHTGEGIDSEAPIFILGMPRSGTTLTEQILATCPDVHAGGEQLVMQRFCGSIPGYPECLRQVGGDWAATQGTLILQRLMEHASGRRFVTDKTPENYRHIGLIHWLFPRARIVYCQRDPMDVGFSCLEQNFVAAISYANDVRSFACAWRAHEEIMAHWQAVLPGRIFTLNYERLIAHPEEEARRLIVHCDLEWTETFLDTTRVDRPIRTASFWQARQPINASSVGKWRRYESELAELIAELASTADR
jgi:tetratricopeptide (TPR) repeat protein